MFSIGFSDQLRSYWDIQGSRKIYNIGRMQEQREDADQSEQTFVEICVRWFQMSRRARKQFCWGKLYSYLAKTIFPDLDMNQLMVPPDIFQQFMQLFLNSLTYMQKRQNCEFVEHLANDILVLVDGRIRYGEKEEEKQGPIAFVQVPLSKNQKITIRTESQSIFLRGERKMLQKLKNDLMRQDRQKKQLFLRQYLFCGLTPNYPQSAVKILYVKENQEINSQNILILKQGLVKRKLKRGEGTQLTAGCLVSTAKMGAIMELELDGFQGETFVAMSNCELISFQGDDFGKVIKSSPRLFRYLSQKLNLLLEERLALNLKNEEIGQQFNEQFKAGTQSLRIHYPIQFKNRPKTAITSANRSFRNKKQTKNSDQSLGQFVTFDRYDKMMVSKEKVVVAKSSFKKQTKVRTIIPLNYEKRIKQQSKMLKLQSGKIQKLTNRDSKMDNTQMSQIRKNLYRVTHLFDQPLDPDLVQRSQQCSKTQFLTEVKTHPRRMSGLKPEQFLKQTYLTQFLSKSSVKSTLKELQSSTPSIENKENTMIRTDSFGLKRRGEPYTINLKRSR